MVLITSIVYLTRDFQRLPEHSRRWLMSVMTRMVRLLRMLLTSALVISCSNTTTELDYTINQTGMVACRYASETMMTSITGYEDLVYGDGTVQSRTQVRNGIADCYEKIEGK